MCSTIVPIASFIIAKDWKFRAREVTSIHPIATQPLKRVDLLPVCHSCGNLEEAVTGRGQEKQAGSWDVFYVMRGR